MAAGAHLIVVGVLADQVHPTGRGDDDRAVSSKVLRKERLRAGNVRGQLHVWMADVVTGRFPSKSNPSIQQLTHSPRVHHLSHSLAHSRAQPASLTLSLSLGRAIDRSIG